MEVARESHWMNFLQSEDMPALVIDNGSHTIRAGFCTEDVPSLEMITNATEGLLAHKDMGDTASDLTQLSNPFECGQVSNWDAMEKVWNYIFTKLETNRTEVPLLLSEPLLCNSSYREKVAEIIFEKFQIPYAHLARQSVLSTYSAGRLSGVVVNTGHHYTDISVIFEGYLVSNTSRCVNMGGHHITDHLMARLTEKDSAMASKLDFNMAQAIKENLCYVAADYDNEMEICLNDNYTLPDGQKVEIREERFQCPEILFQPFLYGRDASDPGLHMNIYSIIAQSDIHIRKDLYQNVILCGGTSLLPGCQERIRSELVSKAPAGTRVKVVASLSRKYAVWLGGAVLASLENFCELSTSKPFYEENGCWKF